MVLVEAKNLGHEGRIPPAGGGHLLSGGQPEAASVPVDDRVIEQRVRQKGKNVLFNKA